MSVANAVVPSHAVAVVMTVTVTGASQSGHVTVLPTAADTGGVPVSSTVNFVAGSTRANQAVDAVTLDAARSVSVYAAVSTHVIIDVVGYVTGPSSPVSQTGLFRLLEVPVSVGSTLAIPAGTPGTGFDVAGRAGVDADAVGVALLAVVSNRTATTSNVTVVADGTTAPTVSSLNPGPGERTAIAVTSGLVSGRVRVVTSQVVDVELFAVGVYVTSITPTLTPASGVGPGVLGFDPLGRLTTTTTGGVTVGYSYLADGTRVAARIQGGGEVYYLGGIEATRTSGVWSQVRRTYPYAGVTVASRTSTATGSGVSWLLGDRQGSVTTTITAGAATTRWYRPYGAARGPSPVNPVVTTGFLGKHEDLSGLTHLDHRDYDPTTGTFITIDPLIATTGEPYQYATANPTTLSDPNGLMALPGGEWMADQWHWNNADQFRSAQLNWNSLLNANLVANGKSPAFYGREHAFADGLADSGDGLGGFLKSAVAIAAGVVAGGLCAAAGEAITGGLATPAVAGVCAMAGGAVSRFTEGLLNGDSIDDATMAATDPTGLLIDGALGYGLGRISKLINTTNKTRALVDSDKYDYLFGNASSNPHNLARSLQNQRQLNAIGIFDTQAGRNLLATHLDTVISTNSNVVGEWTNGWGSFQARESLLVGPNGVLKLESTWQVTSDGFRLTTVIPFGGG